MNKGIIGGIVVLIIALAAGAFYFLTPSLSLLEIVEESSELMEEAETVSFAGTLTVEGTTEKALPNPSEMLGPMFGGAMVDEKNELTEGTIKVTFDGAINNLKEDDKYGWVNLDAQMESTDGNGTAGISMMMVDEDHKFISLSKLELPEEMNSPQVELIVNQLVGEWIQLESDEEEPEDETEESEDDGLFGDDAFTELFEVELTGQKEDIQGIKSQQITLVPNMEAIRAHALEQYKEEHDGDEMPADEVEKMDEAIAAAKDLTGEVWVGVDKAYVHRIVVKGPFEYVEEGSKGNVELVLDLFDYNEPVTPVAPEKTMTMEEFMGRVFSALMGNPALMMEMGGGMYSSY